MRRGILLLFAALMAGGADADYYTEAQVFNLRPRPDREAHFGQIGVTGIVAQVQPGVRVTVQEVLPDSPATGKFAKGDLIVGVNGQALAGRNPFVVLGTALDSAESTDGRLTFEVKTGDATRQEALSVPVLGKYSKTWPLNCEKSAKIAKAAAEFYANDQTFFDKHFKSRGISSALACLFLLSTGDDAYLPTVKAYFERFPTDRGLGDHTWNNGYNGIACAEYYLRTGDDSVLPILQFYCDNASERQAFERGWNHWGYGVHPRYVSGGLMNPAGAQVVTTLLLGLECGLKVDQTALHNSLRFWYRFAGHGTVPYGDHRPEGGLGSNGKDGMAAVMMQVATGARGDVGAYEMARDFYSMSTVSAYPLLIRGHGDNGRGDAIWRGPASLAMLDQQPAEFHAVMNRLSWWFALCRRPGGGFGVTGLSRFDDIGSGIGVALNYTAHLKNLRITGAQRSPHAKAFHLPENLWGTAADRAFLSTTHNPKYFDSEPVHVPFYQLGSAYHKAMDLATIPRDYLLQNIYHKRYVIRCQAAKALRLTERFEDLERLLSDPDPRVRRAALDGLTDYRYWFAAGNGIKPEQFTPGMVAAISSMLKNPEEAWWVIDGALMALRVAPAEAIAPLLPEIMKWTTHDDWWLRESAFMALSGLQTDETMLAKVLPTMNEMMIAEYHTQPRRRMGDMLKRIMKQKKRDSELGQAVLAAFVRAISESEVRPNEGKRILAPEGMYNVITTAVTCMREAPESTPRVAEALQARIDLLDDKQLIELVGTPNSHPEGKAFGLYAVLTKLEPDTRMALQNQLLENYLPALKARHQAGKGRDMTLINSIIDLTRLEDPGAGWQPLGAPQPAERDWRYLTFDPPEKDRIAPGETRRFRKVELPEGLEKVWYQPDFDDSSWQQGTAPIGIGQFRRGKLVFENASEWGDGEFILARTTFEVGDGEHDFYRLSILTKDGYTVYLNGRSISSSRSARDTPIYTPMLLNEKHIAKHLKPGKNVLAIYANLDYHKGKTENPIGQLDAYLEGLKNSDLE